jgi:menaquinone-9 beta-reductase
MVSGLSLADEDRSMSSCDVVVIGGGVAGSTAAFHLCRRGFRVILLEKDRFPRHVVCGEFLSPESRQALERLSVASLVEGAGARTVDSVVLSSAHGPTVRAELEQPGLALSRWSLDHLLLENARRAGVEIREGTAARGVEGSLDDGFEVVTPAGRISARVVVGAYGKRSSIDRVLERPFFSRLTPYVGLKQHFEGVTCGSSVELHAFDGGYCGLVGVERGRMNACSLIRADLLTSDTGGLDPSNPFEGMARLNGTLADRLAGLSPVFSRPVAISQVSFQPKDVMSGDVCMVGDAAGLIAPLCGDGMAMALCGGEQAATCASDFLRGRIDAQTFRREYRETWSREFAGRTRLGRMLQRAYLNASVARVGMGVLNRLPLLMRWMIRATRG